MSLRVNVFDFQDHFNVRKTIESVNVPFQIIEPIPALDEFIWKTSPGENNQSFFSSPEKAIKSYEIGLRCRRRTILGEIQ